jgi:hypothetical protein
MINETTMISSKAFVSGNTAKMQARLHCNYENVTNKKTAWVHVSVNSATLKDMILGLCI